MDLRKLLFILCIICFHQLQAQSVGSIPGTITDEMGQPIPGVSVYLEGFEIGALTDLDGRYLISDVEPGSYNLVASIIGYESQIRYNIIVRSKGTPSYDFSLKTSAEILDEVIIRSDNSSKRTRETPLSVQSLSGVEIATYPGGNNDVVQVMQTFPGVSPSVGGFRNDLSLGEVHQMKQYIILMEWKSPTSITLVLRVALADQWEWLMFHSLMRCLYPVQLLKLDITTRYLV